MEGLARRPWAAFPFLLPALGSPCCSRGQHLLWATQAARAALPEAQSTGGAGGLGLRSLPHPWPSWPARLLEVRSLLGSPKGRAESSPPPRWGLAPNCPLFSILLHPATVFPGVLLRRSFRGPSSQDLLLSACLLSWDRPLPPRDGNVHHQPSGSESHPTDFPGSAVCRQNAGLPASVIV